MNLAEEIQISLVVLLTGLLVVFAVLVFLTYIIKIYGTAIHSAATRKTKNQETKEAVEPAQLPKTQAPIVAPAGGGRDSSGSGGCNCRCCGNNICSGHAFG